MSAACCRQARCRLPFATLLVPALASHPITTLAAAIPLLFLRYPAKLFSQPMATHRRNPSAMVDPKLSVVIPVYNEKTTIDEIIRRVIETPFRKEIVLVDDCSTDGTRQILEKLSELQSSSETQAPAFDGGD